MAICPDCRHENPEDTAYCGRCGAPLKPDEGISVTRTLAAPSGALQKDHVLAGRYRIVEELGRGGMGVVYKAEDMRLKRTVALKFLPPELVHVAEVRERFMREAQAAAGLDHPNICTVHEFEEADGKPFIAMAYVEGRSLRERLAEGPLETGEALRIAAQVAEGLQEAHGKGIVHRDVKSGNVMVTARGRAKVMDFGLARTAGRTLLTREGSTMGTVAYMSPEQAQGREVDNRTDIWSLGVILYEMLTGELPFKGEHEQAVIHSILREKPEPISKARPEVPASVEQVAFRALEKDPDRRYQKIDELMDDLKSISAGIVPEEIRTRIKKEKLRRRKRAFLYGGAGAVGLAAVAVGLLFFAGPAEAIDSIAILPLKNLTGDAGQQDLVDGVTDELIGQLGQVSGLRRVISRTTVMRYKETDKSLPEIARELNVDALIEGTVYQVGENVRVRLQLFDALPEERNLLAQTYERAGTDVLMMYGDIARAVAGKLEIGLTAEEEAHFAGARQVNPRAYEAYLLGMSHWYKLTPPDLETAKQYFESALKEDPDYALAHVGLALFWAGYQQMGLLAPGEATPPAKAAARRALELDDTLPEVHYTWAAIHTWVDWDYEAGKKAFIRAIELNPNYALARIYYSQWLAILGRSDEAIAQAEKALELDPLNSLVQGVCANTFAFARDYDQAIVHSRNALRTSPNDPLGHQILWEMFHSKGQYEEAFSEAKAYFTGLGLTQVVEAMDRGHERGGYPGAIRTAAESMAAFSQEMYVSPWWISIVYSFAGENEQALNWMEKAYEMKDPNMPYIYTPAFNILHDEPRYQDMLRRMNLPPVRK